MRSGNGNSVYCSRLLGLFRLLYIAGCQRPVNIDELRHATTIWTPGDLPHRHWPSYRTKTICFVLDVYLFNLRWTGFTSPQPIVGRVYPSTLAFYQSKGRVDGSLDETVLNYVTRRSMTSRQGDAQQFQMLRSGSIFPPSASLPLPLPPSLPLSLPSSLPSLPPSLPLPPSLTPSPTLPLHTPYLPYPPSFPTLPPSLPHPPSLPPLLPPPPSLPPSLPTLPPSFS